MIPSRQELKINFLNQNILGSYNATPIQGDASLRKYDRISTQYGNIILMDCPPTYCSVKPFMDIAVLLRKHHILTPNIIEADITNGFLLLEDFGDTKIKDVLNNNNEHNYKIYSNIIHILQRIQTIETNEVELHTDDVLLEGINTFIEWYLPIAADKKVLNDHVLLQKIRLQYQEKSKEFVHSWKILLSTIELPRNVFALRDFHVENLMHIDNNRIGVIDFQDAKISYHPYDLVSLLQDARWEVPNELAESLLLLYHSMNKQIPYDSLLSTYHILGLQRNLRILGVFSRKALRDQDYNYMKFIPRVLQYIRANLSHPALQSINKTTVDLLKIDQ